MEKLGKSFTFVNSYVCNRRQPSLELIFQITEILQVNPKELINTPDEYFFIMAKHKEQHKKSIRFFNDREVRAVWDEEQNCWWFSATDIVRAINNEPDYTKAGNYWRWLKGKLKQKDIELVSATHSFKFEVPDGKLRVAEVLNSESVVLLAKNYPNNRANDFLGWFTYSDNSIDGQSKKNAYQFFESGILQTIMVDSVKCQ